MGGRQSQESPIASIGSSGGSHLPPPPDPIVSRSRELERESESDRVLSLPPFFLSGPASHERARNERRDESFHSLFDDHTHEEEELSENSRELEMDFSRHRHQDGLRGTRHHQDASAHHSHHHSHQDRSHHRRRHHDGDRQQERHSHNRRGRRYVYGEMDSSSERNMMEMDFSWSALSQRLRALQLSRESEEAEGSSPSSSSSSRRNRSHSSGSHSRSRHHMGGPGSLFFLRPPERRSPCPFCKKDITSSEMEEHLVMCMTKPRIKFNEDRLIQDAGECSICLDEMNKGDHIARLPCLCVYHIKCLKLWYERSQTCPEHPEFRS